MKTILIKEARLAVNIKDWNKGTISALKKLFTKDNPKFFMNRAMGFGNWNTPEKIKSWEQDEDWLLLPREASEIIFKFLTERKIKIVKQIDKTIILEPCNFELKFPLYPYQTETVDKLIESGTGGVLRGPPGSGKTNILLGYIAQLKQPTLVVVHSGTLLRQWRERVIEWLGIIPGNIGDGKKDVIRPITIAMQQTLWKRSNAPWLNEFGALIGDECLKMGAPILMADGTEKPIESIQVGERVAFGGLVIGKMNRFYKGDLYELNKCFYTPNHPIKSNFNQWIPISKLKNDDYIYRFKWPDTFGFQYRAKPILKNQDTVVFNLETENHVYIAGNIHVHNCHKWGAKTFNHISTFFPARYRVGASADEKRKDRMEHLIYETFGKVVHEIEKSELESLGRLVPVRIEPVKTNYVNQNYLESIEMEIIPDWGGMISDLVLDEERNKIILEQILKVLDKNKTNRILMLTNLIKSVDYWIDTLEHLQIPIGKMIGGQANKNELETAIIDLKKGNIRIAIATSVADEGLDIPPLTHVFLICPVHKNPKRMVQMMGRAARKYGNKKEGVCIYFWDQDMFPIKRTDDLESRHLAKQKIFIRKLKSLGSEK